MDDALNRMEREDRVAELDGGEIRPARSTISQALPDSFVMLPATKLKMNHHRLRVAVFWREVVLLR